MDAAVSLTRLSGPPSTSRVMRMESPVAGIELDDTRKAYAGPGRCATLLVPPLRMNLIDIKAIVVERGSAMVRHGGNVAANLAKEKQYG